MTTTINAFLVVELDRICVDTCGRGKIGLLDSTVG